MARSEWPSVSGPDVAIRLERLAMRVEALEREPVAPASDEESHLENARSVAEEREMANPLEIRDRALARATELARSYEARITEEVPDPAEAESLQAALGEVSRRIAEANPSNRIAVDSARCAESLCSFWVEHDEAEALHQLLVQGVFAGPLAGGTVTAPHESGRGTTVYVKRRI